MSGYGGNQTARRKTNAFDKQLDTFGALPEVRLVLSILTRAGLDALNGDWRAVAFIQSPDFENYCDWIGVNAERLRARLMRR